MDLFLQVNYNQTTQFDPNPSSTHRSKDDNGLTMLMIFMVVLIVGSIVWQMMVRNNFNEAKEAFQRNPNDPEAKQDLIQAAKSQRDYGRSTNDVVALLEAQHDREKRQSPKKSIATELETLAELRDSGALTDDEFEKAKSKLLN